MADTQIVGSVSSEDGVTWKLHPGNSASGLKGNTAYRVRPVGPELNVTTLASMSVITAAISPNPLQAGKPGAITFNAVPENVGGNVALTASDDDLTYTFMVPDFGSVFITAASSGYEPFSQTYTPDSETIQAVVAPVPTPTYAGKKISDIPGVTTTLQASNYTRAGRTINAPQLRRNGQPTTLATVLAKGDVVDVLVTDNLGGSETYLLTTTQYAVEIAPLSGGLYRSIDDNPLLPDGLLFPVSYLGATTQTSQARLATGPESHIHVSIVKEGSTYTATPGKWFSRVAGTTELTHQWLKNGTAIPGAIGLTLAHIADFDGATISVQETATDASGARTRASNGISNADVTAPVLSAPTHNTATNAYGYTTTKPGTLYWAAYTSGGAVPAVNAQGVWTGTTRQTGSLTLQTAGAKAFTPAVTDTQANRLVFAVVDAAGNVSNHLDQPYTQHQTAGEAGKVPDLLTTYHINSTTKLPVQTFADVALGAADPRRDIIFAVVNTSNGTKATALDVIIDGQTIAAELIATKGSAETTLHTSSVSLFKARLPNGTTAAVDVKFSGGSNSAGVVRLGVLRGINVDINDVFMTNTVVQVDAKPRVVVDLTNLTPGRTLFAFATASTSGSLTWAGATKVFEENTRASDYPSSLATHAIQGAAHQFALIPSNTNAGQMAVIGFTAGASA